MKKIIVIFTIFLLTGCTLRAFNGTWIGDMISTRESTEERVCGTANLNLTISDGEVEGTATVGYGYELSIRGSVNEEGEINADLWGDDDVEATLTGTVNGDTAGGTWSDKLGCYGTFALSR